jgi:hypothetical protein
MSFERGGAQLAVMAELLKQGSTENDTGTENDPTEAGGTAWADRYHAVNS